MRLIAVNAGSSSLKLSVIDAAATTVASRDLGGPDDPGTQAGLAEFLGVAGPVDGVVHRIVQGGAHLNTATVVDAAVRRDLDAAAVLAPLHVPVALRMLDIVGAQVAAPAVACFDTSFHATMPVSATTYAIPRRWRELGVRRYGFHGLSHAWATRRTAELLDRPADGLCIVVAHLGGGASVTAVRNGLSVNTSMGFSPLDGLVMATRSGSIDPAAVLWLQSQHRIEAGAIIAALEHESGMLAVCGTADMRDLLVRADGGDASSMLAREIYAASVAKGVAAMATALDRIDAVAFTGGIGEHSGDIRNRVCARLAVIGVAVPGTAVLDAGADAVVSATDARVAVLRIHAREDLQMAAEAEGVLGLLARP